MRPGDALEYAHVEAVPRVGDEVQLCGKYWRVMRVVWRLNEESKHLDGMQRADVELVALP